MSYWFSNLIYVSCFLHSVLPPVALVFSGQEVSVRFLFSVGFLHFLGVSYFLSFDFSTASVK